MNVYILCYISLLAGRICYTRDFLIGLARCPEAKKKPEFLPEHPIVLTEAVRWLLTHNFNLVSSLNWSTNYNCTIFLL